MKLKDVLAITQIRAKSERDLDFLIIRKMKMKRS